jgi:hypothetical protein
MKILQVTRWYALSLYDTESSNPAFLLRARDFRGLFRMSSGILCSIVHIHLPSCSISAGVTKGVIGTCLPLLTLIRFSSLLPFCGYADENRGMKNQYRQAYKSRRASSNLLVKVIHRRPEGRTTHALEIQVGRRVLILSKSLILSDMKLVDTNLFSSKGKMTQYGWKFAKTVHCTIQLHLK